MIIITVLTTCVALLLSSLLFILKKKQHYWEIRGVPHEKPTLLLGNYGPYILLNKYFGQVTQRLCKTFPNEPYFGTYYGTDPALVVKDPEIIKLVLTKDFYYFSGREASDYSHKEITTQNLFFTYGDRWKVIRQNLTPLFSTSKMRKMFYLIEKYSHVFEKILDDEIGSSRAFEVKSLIARYTMDCVGSCSFGVDTMAMQESPKSNIFSKMAHLFFENTNYRGFKMVARSMWPGIFYGLGFKSFPVEVDKFLNNLLSGVFKGRDYKPSSRNDFVDLVLNLRNSKIISGDSLENMKTGGKKKVELEVDDDLLVAQCVAFFGAGFETSATTLAFTLFELAKDEVSQRRALAEVDGYMAKYGNRLDYEVVSELPFLDACLDEALRLYPLLGVLTREVVDDYSLSGLKLERGLRVHIPVFHIQRDAKHFPQPEQFLPDRFMPEQKRKINPYTYLPFGEGPRICIGMRFAKMQMLAGLVTLLKKYRLELAPGMKKTVEFEPRVIVTQPVGGIHLKLIARDGWETRRLSRGS